MSGYFVYIVLIAIAFMLVIFTCIYKSNFKQLSVIHNYPKTDNKKVAAGKNKKMYAVRKNT